jgi:hypothetical protein
VNSGAAEREKAHRLATAQAREARCLLCFSHGAVPAHYPKHRGMGGGKAGWGPKEWIPLCVEHHDLIDGRLGVSEKIERRRQLILALLPAVAQKWWDSL